MSFKSEAHRKKLAELVKEGKMTQKQYDEFSHATPHGIPERVEKPKKMKSLLPRRRLK